MYVCVQMWIGVEYRWESCIMIVIIENKGEIKRMEIGIKRTQYISKEFHFIALYYANYLAYNIVLGMNEFSNIARLEFAV